MGEEEPAADLNSLRDNPMAIMILSEKGGHGTSLFVFRFFLFIWFLGLTKPYCCIKIRSNYLNVFIKSRFIPS
jgi:hypothetical protein